MKKFPEIKPFGERAFLLEWESTIDPAIHQQVLNTEKALFKFFRKDILETVYTYHSLAIYLKDNVEIKSFIRKIHKCLGIKEPEKKQKKFIIHIPVCYEPEFGMDIPYLVKLHNLSPEEIQKIHTQPLYYLYFLGFLPGFPYLGGLDKKLHTPRKSTPRNLIERGSVGIGGSQTGIYTVNSPGGWNIIGKCPLEFFNCDEVPFSLLNAGDYIKFSAISKDTYLEIEEDVKSGQFKLKKEENFD